MEEFHDDALTKAISECDMWKSNYKNLHGQYLVTEKSYQARYEKAEAELKKLKESSAEHIDGNMTPAIQIAQGIVTKFNGEGACLSNTDETYLEDLIAAALREYGEELLKSDYTMSLFIHKRLVAESDAEGYRRGVEWCVSVLENGTGGEGTTELQDATLLHYARKLQRGTGGGE